MSLKGNAIVENSELFPLNIAMAGLCLKGWEKGGKRVGKGCGKSV